MRLLLLAALLLVPALTGCTTTSWVGNRDYAQPWETPYLGYSGMGSTH
ncbi:hypothetical protein [Pseudaminobacter soli (ex Li et al. 2025)]|nr:hypothetical protein [Mesorhizobium soli]